VDLIQKQVQLLWIDDAHRGLADITAGRTQEADNAIGKLQRRRDLAASVVSPAISGTRTTKKRVGTSVTAIQSDGKLSWVRDLSPSSTDTCCGTRFLRFEVAIKLNIQD
jgi:hypothetical protein